MSRITETKSLSSLQRILLLVSALIFALILFLFRNGLKTQSPLDQLARRSLEPEIALTNGRPTVFEFYADWCEACKKMAPAVLSIEKQKEIDIVLLNVDNQRWQDLIEKYNVNGIPQLDLFDKKGNPIGRYIGLRTEEEIKELTNALIGGKELPQFPGSISKSYLGSRNKNVSEITLNSELTNPRSHGF